MDAARASHEGTLVGTWRLVSFEAEERDTGKRWPTFGKAPKGRLILQVNGLMMVMLTAEGRPAQSPKTTEERAKAFTTVIAYSGRYRTEGESFVTDVDLSSVEAWVGAKQIRTFRIVGPRVQFVSAWAPDPFDSRRTTRGIIEFEREA